MSRLRWPDSTNSVSDDPGTVQNPYTRLVLNHQLLLLDPLRATRGYYEEIDGTADCFLAILKAEGLNRAANAKDREINRVLQREELKWYS